MTKLMTLSRVGALTELNDVFPPWGLGEFELNYS